MTGEPHGGQRAAGGKPAKSLRWATTRRTGASAQQKRLSILDRLHRHGDREKARHSGNSDLFAAAEAGTDANPAVPVDEVEEETGRRRVFFNIPLPDDAKDAKGQPREHFERNKIRTAKYTPLSFVPKNLWYQFHNIANIYFLFLIILGVFAIFGASEPALNAAPLIAILVITGIKDAIEDWRRTILDNELNNSPVTRLVNFDNVNVSADNVSMWRRFKKANTRAIKTIYHLLQRKKGKKLPGKGYAERAADEPRPSNDTHANRQSLMSERTSFYSTRTPGVDESIPLDAVPSPHMQNGAPTDSLSAPQMNMQDNSLRTPNAQSSPAKSATQQTGDRRAGDLIDPFAPVTGKAAFKSDFWKSVQVGDFVRIYGDDEVPADIAILNTSDPDGGCYIETKNLDGETNLKVRHALHCGRRIKHARDCERARFMIESELAHANLYQYQGVVRWHERDARKPDDEGEERTEPISINNILLRGCTVRNTDWILGVVVFTGRETKIMLNAGITPSKRARIARELNYNVIYNFCILFIMCLVAAIVNGIAWGTPDQSLSFFEVPYAQSPALVGFINFWTALILFQNLVPISLYITLEIIRTLQAFFIYSDVGMYYDKIDYPCTPKSWNISDDLGQVEYIFSDKTGTLTQNVMEFKKCSINGVPYGEAYTEALAGMQRRQGIDVEAESARANKQIAEDRVKMLQLLREKHDNPYLHDDKLTFVAPTFVEDLNGAAGEEQAQADEEFMLALAVCHTVIADKVPGDPPAIDFKAQSPDEAALVATARDCGFTVMGHERDDLVVNVFGCERRFRVLNILEFNSSRKRMSVIVRMPDGRIILYCKGADSVIYARLQRNKQQELKQQTAEHLEMFAREGLRTLCLSRKYLNEEEYAKWNKQYDVAAAAIDGRDEKLDALADAIETDLELLGGTAIEDRLQDGVPDTIALLGRAGIKLWVLTGDRVETAINIGFSCNLLDNSMDLIVLKLDEEDHEAASRELDRHLRTFGLTGTDAEMAAARKDHEAPAATHAIVLDGDALKVALDDELRQRFLLLCKQCKSVLCCRVSPSQKAAVVAMVKSGLDVMTLAIGDGANDVAMIQEADIGVGIAGEEGRQAVMSSDYAIGQFRFLQRLVLVHGRWSYRRLAETIANFFYKNLVWTFTLFWYGIYDNFDGAYLFDYTYLTMYNLAFTSLPIIFMGILDQDVSDKVSLAVPQLYRRGIERKEWTPKKFWLYMLDGLYQSLAAFYVTYLLVHFGDFVTRNGRDATDRVDMGIFVATTTVLAANLYFLMNIYRWDWLMLLLSAISILLVWFWTGVFGSSQFDPQFYQAAPQVYGTLAFWAVILWATVVCLLPRFLIKSVQKIFFPYDVDIIREQVRLGKFKSLDDLPPDASPSKLESAMSSDPATVPQRSKPELDDEARPIYPPSTAPTSTTYHQSSAAGSDGSRNTTDTGNGHRKSFDHVLPPIQPTASRSIRDSYRLSSDRPRHSFERVRTSLDLVRPSFEASQDFTSANRLMRLDSNQSDRLRNERTPTRPSNLRE